MKILLRVGVVLAFVAAVAVFSGLRSYRVFTREELAAVVRCEAAPPGSSYRFRMEVAQVRRGMPGRFEVFPMTGDEWSVGGHILKWKPWATFLGAKSCYKLTRLSSRWERAKDEMEKPKAAYDLNGGSSLLWRWLYRWGAVVPLVDAVYGNAAYVQARPGGRWGVYVNSSGYLIRPLGGSS